MKRPAIEGENPPSRNSTIAAGEGGGALGSVEPPAMPNIAIVPQVRRVIEKVSAKNAARPDAGAFGLVLISAIPLQSAVADRRCSQFPCACLLRRELEELSEKRSRPCDGLIGKPGLSPGADGLHCPNNDETHARVGQIDATVHALIQNPISYPDQLRQDAPK